MAISANHFSVAENEMKNKNSNNSFWVQKMSRDSLMRDMQPVVLEESMSVFQEKRNHLALYGYFLLKFSKTKTLSRDFVFTERCSATRKMLAGTILGKLKQAVSTFGQFRLSGYIYREPNRTFDNWNVLYKDENIDRDIDATSTGGSLGENKDWVPRESNL